MKRIASILLVFLILMCVGCNNQQTTNGSYDVPETGVVETSQSDTLISDAVDEGSRKITVYYIKGFGVSSLMSAVKDQIPEDITLDIHEFTDENSMKQEIDTGGMPDLLLLEEGMYREAMNPYTLIADGKAAPLSSYIEGEKQTGTLKEEDFFQGVFTVGEIENDVYYLPLSMKSYFGITSESKYADSPLSALDQNYTLEEMIDTLLLDKEQNKASYMLTFPRMTVAPDETALFMEIMLETGVIKQDPNTGEVIIVNEELLEKLKDYCKVVSDDLTKSGNIKNSDRFDTFYEDYLMVTPNMNIAHQTRYWQSALSELLQENEKLVFFPSCDKKGAYGASANIIGLVGADSTEKNAAYRVLRSMMEIPGTTWIGITIGDTPNALGPVCRKSFEEELQALTDDYGSKYKLNAQTFTREALGEAQKEALSDWSDKVEIKPILSMTMYEFVAKLLG